MTGVRLEPLDTWFFRDGTPFTRDSAPQEGVRSLFPPHPPTVVGAIRAALALSRGWSGRGRWSQEIARVLGDGPESLGVLSLDGPFVLRNEEPLFRAPRHLLGVDEPDGWRPAAFLRPGAPVECDLGADIRLPDTSTARADDDWSRRKAGDNQWLTPTGMNAVLRGELPAPDDIVSSRALWSDELRIGLERDRDTRTAKEGLLYSTRHVRLACSVSLGVRISGLPPDWRPPFGRTLSFGGESRTAACHQWNAALSLDASLPTTNGGRVAIIALTPLDLADDACLGSEPLEELGGARVVCACLDRPLRIGGWDSLARRPLPLRSVLPPGSVLFCEGAAPVRLRHVITTGGGLARVGARRPLGFGLAALGAWPRDQEVGG